MATKKNTKIGNNEYYRIRRTIDGKQKAFYGSSKGDAERKYKEYLEQRARDACTEAQSLVTATLGERSMDFITNTLKVSQKYANSTAYRYERSYMLYIKPSSLNDMILAEVKASDIQQFYNNLDVSMQTIKGINKFLSAFCKWAQLNEYSGDFMSATEIPKKPENKRHDEIVILEDDEIRAMLDQIEGHRLYFFVYVLLYTGVRISEAIALKYSDIDDGVIHVVRQYYMGEMKAPKYNSARDIPMHEELIKAFDVHKEWHKRDMRRNKYKTDFLFTTSNGTLYDAVNIRRALKRFCDSHGIPYKHPHAYRATFCTQLCRCGVPLEVASKLLGHKSLEVTARHYNLVRQDTIAEAISKFSY